MAITATGLTKAAAVATATAGAIFVAVQINHPPMTAETTETLDWAMRSTAKALMGALAVFGLTGMYLRQHREAGVLGLVGYVTFAVGYLMIMATEVIALTVLPVLAGTNPAYVDAVLVTAAGGTPATDIGLLEPYLALSGMLYLLGGLILAIALVRTGVLWRWASVLLGLGVLGTGALAVLPESFNRPMAVPIGLALIALGVSLWRSPAERAAGSAEPHAHAGAALS
ncbi:hypothetical protein [Myceligenerans indicum]|uniref:DUF4386 family protein n=1 Tax=Myceligenerans indicum TaxID=2593663 RepID=A0ABS1LF76_9MICO|nr:hypothetical protein [Myceligenerans indicum]MBL0884907.1 hypothetical protein [Myceligenerans indicum]